MWSRNSSYSGAGPSNSVVEATCMWAGPSSRWRKEVSSPLSRSPCMPRANLLTPRDLRGLDHTSSVRACGGRRTCGSLAESCRLLTRPATPTPSSRTGASSSKSASSSAGHRAHPLGVAGRLLDGPRARVGAERAQADLQRHRAARRSRPRRARGRPSRRGGRAVPASIARSETSAAKVVSRLSDFRSRSVDHGAVVVAAGAVAELAAEPGAEGPLERRRRRRRRARPRSGCRAAASRSAVRGPTPGIRVAGRSPTASSIRSGSQHAEAVGLVEVGGDLGEQLVRRQPDRADEAGLGAHLALQLPGAGLRRRALGEVEVGLVQAGDLDPVAEPPQDLHHLARGAPVERRCRAGPGPPAGSAGGRSRAAAPSGRRTGAPRRRPPSPRPRAAASVPVATTTGLPRSSGRRSSSTETKNASMSTWATVRGPSLRDRRKRGRTARRARLGRVSGAEAKNLEAISRAIDQHNANCPFPAAEVRMNPFEIERLGWEEIRGLPIVGDPALGTGPLPDRLLARLRGRRARGGRGGRRAGRGRRPGARAELSPAAVRD